MRNVLLAGIAATVLTAAGPAAAATRNYGVSGFDRVRVDGPFKVKLVTGHAPFARANGSSIELDGLAIDVQGRTLVVHSSQSKWVTSASAGGGPITVEIGTHDLTSAILNGAGTLAIDKVRGLTFGLTIVGSGAVAIAQADVDKLDVAVSGTSNASISGRAKQMTAIVRGISTLDAAALTVKDATIGVDGAATVAAQVTNAVKVSGSGPGNVTLTGRPACTLKVVGSGSVSGCK
ncbi:MAG TPA: DUF2807 domain-containing protein [Sphingomicrobium sp.]|nr:DUF2807 domain-containing protein [Sphingomicrobium sp.]